jgi:hypothetical protein
MEYSISTTSNATLFEGTKSHLLCPTGSTVINISGRGGFVVDQITMTCSDGTVLGPVGGGGGSIIKSSNCTSGYSGVDVTYGSPIGMMTVYCWNSTSPIVSIGYNAGSDTNYLRFPRTQALVGMQVYHGAYVNAIAFLNMDTIFSTLQPMIRSPAFTVWPHPWITHKSPWYGDLRSIQFVEQISFCPPGSKIVSLSGTGASLVYEINAICDDIDNTTLGPLGITMAAVDQKMLPRCSTGYKGWNITFGNYMGQLRCMCALPPYSIDDFIGYGLEGGSGSRGHMSLSFNQTIIGFHIYYDTLGIKSASIIYADIPSSDGCMDSSLCFSDHLTKVDMLYLLWGFLAMTGLGLSVTAILVYIVRKRHKEEFAKNDTILPLR